MSAIEFVLRAALTATFLLSAAGKTMALEQSSRMLADLVPWPGRPTAIALVLAEALTAVGVATARNGLSADIGVGAALALALLFTGASIQASLGGRRLTCACFGSLRPAQALGWHTLVRALIIAAAAAGWRLAINSAPPTSAGAADRAALSFVIAAALGSAIAWNYWRTGIAHRRFATEAIHLQSQGSPSRAHESS